MAGEGKSIYAIIKDYIGINIHNLACLRENFLKAASTYPLYILLKVALIGYPQPPFVLTKSLHVTSSMFLTTSQMIHCVFFIYQIKNRYFCSRNSYIPEMEEMSLCERSNGRALARVMDAREASQRALARAMSARDVSDSRSKKERSSEKREIVLRRYFRGNCRTLFL